jgi:hypothetical protein
MVGSAGGRDLGRETGMDAETAIPHCPTARGARRAIAAAFGFAFGCAVAAAADAEPAVIVEDMRPDIAGLELLALLEPGEVIVVPAGGKLILGYLRSCQRETISGGRVVIGVSESAITGGTVDRSKVDCPGGGRASGHGVQVMAGISVRGLGNQPKGEAEAAAKPGASGTETAAVAPADAIAVDHRSPLVMLPAAKGVLEISRIGASGSGAAQAQAKPAKPDWRIPVTNRLVDLAAANIRLDPGAFYLLAYEGRAVRIEITQIATDGDVPALARLVRF